MPMPDNITECERALLQVAINAIRHKGTSPGGPIYTREDLFIAVQACDSIATKRERERCVGRCKAQQLPDECTAGAGRAWYKEACRDLAAELAKGE